MPTASLLYPLIAGGVFAAVVPTGWYVLRTLGVQRTGSLAFDVGSMVPVGVAFWSIPLAIAAYAGAFDPVVVGAVGWAVAAIVVFLNFGFWRATVRPFGEWRWLVAAGIAVLVILYGGFPNETMLGNRDEGLYSLIAIALARTGGLAVAMPAEASIAPAMFMPFINGQPFYLPGIYQTVDGLAIQFPALLPPWIAQFAAATGGYGLFRVSALFALGSVVAFHALACRFVGKALALVATVVFALNPAQIWIARINLVEPLAQLIVLGGLLIAVRSLDEGSRRPAVLAGMLFGVAAFGRLDVVVLAPLLLGALLVVTVCGYRCRKPTVTVLGVVAASTVAAQGIAVGLLALASPLYFSDNVNAVGTAGTAVLLAIAGLFVVRSGAAQKLRQPKARNQAAAVTAVALTALFVYAAWIRPHVEPFALVSRVGSGLDGTRDFRERSLLNLAAYLGWPVVVAALVGSVIAAGRAIRGRAHASIATLALVFVATAIGVLANPRVSPDHFWGVRRYVPLVIPGAILLATYAVHALAARLAIRPRKFAPALSLVAGLALLALQWPTLFVRENRGLTTQMGDLNTMLGTSRLVIVRDLDSIAATLALAYSRAVLPLRDGAVPVDASGREFWTRCTREDPCALLHGDFSGIAGLVLGATRQATITREVIAPATVPLPRATAKDTIRMFVTPVYGLADETPSREVGAARHWNVDDSGFYREETVGTMTARWTNGDAAIALPATDADTLEVVLMSPDGSAGSVRIMLDGVVLHDAPLVGMHRLVFALPRTSGTPPRRMLRITSPRFVPKLTGHGPDERALGVWISSIRTFSSRTPRLRLDSESRSFAGSVSIAGAPFLPALAIDAGSPSPRLAVVVDNAGNTVWPAAGDVQAGETPVLLGIVWRRADDGVAVLEQRAGFANSVHPGERIRLPVSLDPHTSNGAALPPGNYVVELGLLQEYVAWFVDRGATNARLSVNILGPGRSGR